MGKAANMENQQAAYMENQGKFTMKLGLLKAVVDTAFDLSQLKCPLCFLFFYSTVAFHVDREVLRYFDNECKGYWIMEGSDDQLHYSVVQIAYLK